MQRVMGVPVLGCRELFFAAQREGGERAMRYGKGNEKIGNCDTANAVDAGGPKGKDDAIGDWTELNGFADVGLTRFSAVWLRRSP
jgi:hypothetical protein